jgi:glucose 1-dehydrogenase
MSPTDSPVAVVTGAGSGIGSAIAKRLLADGWLVVGIERLEANADGLERILGTKGEAVRGDVSELAVLERAGEAAERMGRLLGWVNNAAIATKGTLHIPDAEEVREVFAVNLIAPFWGSSVAVRSFLRHGVAGRIVNVSSIHGTHSFPEFAAYDTAKGGVNALTRYTAVEYGVAGIRANAIAPGAIRTEMLDSMIKESADPALMERDMAALHPLERLGEPAEIAAAVAFLLSDESSFVNGQVIGVDGGANARPYRFESSPDIPRRGTSADDGSSETIS